ncbi:MAG: bifunctional UDP-N-acetylglucosamine diphosphorylase/glucosamine-1-phosphate N-acetyltransferase GlmU [Peptoniphilaceae bacterium]|uniref:bifunctional UDP-N-acetylglucosamine diphosphorylase/glucosamine-1-phosphate N-acetyltransferase GlmU n=1 Tax=Parvimonas sp. TaxID=1944660 RepID=UPI0025E3682C|nr:bifunctional UDP-N-acetylglucosamine diphosphorylase/glucosamine-1-phosphate N-acetyltransferase GlmU [Parvimonas sp.]MCI5996635.1 bifunctional UDP-N-acetylglucosamine diphosphorylase/glucosamine-1-phosphate N-acetyltransferase GlmU [Parvimonas sp.]MDD7765241.1 bifunctional UDP-N-acetylglucosamine diphosphorylase/glucosamine-1-phosphate N-acetyltransferase GlmU [Peptoniphilaceae bacterium]MDY3051323.1 bifunctional UDP-N-acetylglucosamine diphosphorylase/glucosamine-1-phosphate N-acetyltransfe
MNITIILAAGEGTRMKSKKSKVLHKIANKSLIDYVYESGNEAGADKTIIIVGKNKDMLKEKFKDSVIYKEQKIGKEYPYGTGYAVQLAEDEIDDEDNVLVLSGDTPLIKGETLKMFFENHITSNAKASVLTAFIDDTTGYGHIIKDENGKFIKIVEDKDANEFEKKVKEINSGIYAFNGKFLKYGLKKIDTDNAQNELYLTDVIKVLVNEKEFVDTYNLDDVEEIHGINSKLQLFEAEKIMRNRINTEYMKNGVIMENPENTVIEKGIEIGKDTFIGSGVRIFGNTIIGENVYITGDTLIENSVIGNDVLIKSSYIENSIVEDEVTIGPYAHLRPNSTLKKKVHIGNFVEVKNSTLGENTKAGHLSYIGDASVGKDVNMGCGSILVNYDGKSKHRSKIGDGCFVGSNSNIVSPVDIANDTFIAAGTTLVSNVVKEGSLIIGRSETYEKENWVYKKNLKIKK